MSLIPYSLARSVLFNMDAEAAHEHTLSLLAAAQNTPLQWAFCQSRIEDPVQLAGLRLPNMDLLKKVLRQSHSRKWVKNGPVNVLDPDYPNGKSVSCWVFQQPVRTDRIV